MAGRLVGECRRWRGIGLARSPPPARRLPPRGLRPPAATWANGHAPSPGGPPHGQDSTFSTRDRANRAVGRSGWHPRAPVWPWGDHRPRAGGDAGPLEPSWQSRGRRSDLHGAIGSFRRAGRPLGLSARGAPLDAKGSGPAFRRCRSTMGTRGPGGPTRASSLRGEMTMARFGARAFSIVMAGHTTSTPMRRGSRWGRVGPGREEVGVQQVRSPHRSSDQGHDRCVLGRELRDSRCVARHIRSRCPRLSCEGHRGLGRRYDNGYARIPILRDCWYQSWALGSVD